MSKSAYAFRDFDAQRILQRPFFRELKLTTDDDAKILKSLRPADEDTVDALEEKLQRTKAIHERLGEFLQFINRHIETRLAPYSAATKKPATFDYVTDMFFCRDLAKKFSSLYFETEKLIQARYKKELCARIRRERQARGMTQKQLGDLVQVSSQGFSLYERGERDFPLYTLIRLAKILNISGDKILGLSDK